MKYYWEYIKLVYTLWNYKREKKQIRLSEFYSIETCLIVHDAYKSMILNTKRELVKLKKSKYDKR